jgi:copper/silver efflux system protein
LYLIFEDGTDMYWARSRVLEYLNYVRGRLPAGVDPSLGPDATGVGWVYQYALVDKTGQRDLAELRTLQDWYLRYPLQTVRGVAEVASLGGFVKQYQVEVDPNALLAYNIPLSKVKEAISRSNRDVGGRLIEMAETEYMVRGLGYIQSIEDINHIPLGVDGQGTPLRLQDVARVHLGPELRRGVAELDGEGEVAGGIVVMRFEENALATIQRVRAKLEELAEGLPEGVEIVPVYDRGALIERAVDNLRDTLIEEALLVSLIIGLFLFHVRSTLVVILSLPVAVLAAFILMWGQGINANIMSLGGIAITLGAMLDSAIVMIENAHKHLERATAAKGQALSRRERWATVEAAAQEVGPPLFYSLAIMTVSFLVIFALEAQEGRLFRPLAFTATYTMAAGAILAITLMPLLVGYFARGRILPEKKNPANRLLRFLFTPVLRQALHFRKITLAVALALLAVTVYPLAKLGSEFMPPLDEGDILYMPTTFPGLSITKAKEVLQQTDKILRTFPEVQRVFGKAGRAETATDPAPLAMFETTVQLKSREEWPDPAKPTSALMSEMDAAIQFPGLTNAWTMPIRTRIDMLTTGIRTPVGIKVSGPDLTVLERVAGEIERTVKEMPETLSAFADRTAGGYYLDFEIQRQEAARYGLTVDDIQEVIQSAIGGMNVTETVEGLERYPVNLRYPRELRDNLPQLKRVLVPTPTGAQIPLAQVADLQLRRGPPSIKTEDSLPNAWIYVDLKTADVGGYVAKAREVLQREVEIPPGYTLTWSGQYEYMERAAARLQVMVPLTLFIVFLLLYLNFRNLTAPLVLMLLLPFALSGGVWLLYWLDFNLSVAVGVGFIALIGVAIETGVLVLAFIDGEVAQRRQAKLSKTEAKDRENEETPNAGSAIHLSPREIRAAAYFGTLERIRPLFMTDISTIGALLPIMWGVGTGSETMQRIAAPMIGGLVTVQIMNLVVLPVVYSLVLQVQERIRYGRAE